MLYFYKFHVQETRSFVSGVSLGVLSKHNVHKSRTLALCDEQGRGVPATPLLTSTDYLLEMTALVLT